MNGNGWKAEKEDLGQRVASGKRQRDKTERASGKERERKGWIMSWKKEKRNKDEHSKEKRKNESEQQRKGERKRQREKEKER